VADFQQKQSKLPDSLQELVPVYFDDVPKVPGTSDSFEYYVKDGKYYVGDKATIVALQTGVSPSKPGQGGVFLKADSTVPLSANVQKALIDSLKDEGSLQQVATVYDPTGKRDPFRPFDFAPVAAIDESKTPLERYDVNQLKLTAVLSGISGEPTATVENAAGKGFIVKKGVKIGLNSGEIVDVKPDRLVVVETTVDFTGQKKTKTIELRLRTKDQEDNRTRKGL
jgi:type IV pilus assembly protein PilP